MYKKSNLAHSAFSFFTLFGLPVTFLPLLAYLLKTHPHTAIRASLIFAATEAVCASIKFLYRKERPVPIHKVPVMTFFHIYEAGSFPSIHTARITSFFVITTALFHNPVLAVGTGILVIAVACSRIYLKKHYLIDVAGGFLIGALISTGGLLI